MTPQRALRFVILIGIVSLFADMVYEGARSISGPFLGMLGASGAAIGVAAGLGELVGFGLRPLFGALSDRTGKYWLFTIVGYSVSALAIPALAFTNDWRVAIGLLTIERLSKAIRRPSKDVILSQATEALGHGRGFGIHEVLDQIGAVTAPLLLAAILGWRGDYHLAFLLLAIPGALTVATLLFARSHQPQSEPPASGAEPVKQTLSLAFWVYMAGIGAIAAGYVDYPLIAFHAQKVGALTPAFVPLAYALAMAVDAGSAYLFGVLFDRYGLRILSVSALIAAFFAPLVFAATDKAVLCGVVLWGIGLGAQESVLRAAVAKLAPMKRRGTAYGVFNMGYGICWFAGSALLGALYNRSIAATVSVSLGLQLVGVVLLLSTWIVERRQSTRAA